MIFKTLGSDDLAAVVAASQAVQDGNRLMVVTDRIIEIDPGTPDDPSRSFDRSDGGFRYAEKLGQVNEICIVGGGHCALALSELMSRLDFRIRIFDDRPELNTIEKNRFADEITIIDSYEAIGDHIRGGDSTYVVVMTLGYRSDDIVIRQLIGRKFRYFGVLGSKAKMATLLRQLVEDGIGAELIAGLKTPVGLTINSHSPEEIAVSIAAEIISVKNA